MSNPIIPNQDRILSNQGINSEKEGNSETMHIILLLQRYGFPEYGWIHTLVFTEQFREV